MHRPGGHSNKFPNLANARRYTKYFRYTMKLKKVIISFFALFLTLTAFANKDRYVVPYKYIFIFKGNDSVFLKQPSDFLLKEINEEIISGKKVLVEAILTFPTGEIAVFKRNGVLWEMISISQNNKEIFVPKLTVQKIKEIHFNTVALLWPGSYESPSKSKSFHIRFDIGAKKSYDRFPTLNLFFSSGNFSSSSIKRQLDNITSQDSDF